MRAVRIFEPELFKTEEEYLAFEDAAETKHEYVDGHVYDWPGYDYDAEGMVGTRRGYNDLQINFIRAVWSARQGGWLPRIRERICGFVSACLTRAVTTTQTRWLCAIPRSEASEATIRCTSRSRASSLKS